jgi:hypothetical protein
MLCAALSLASALVPAVFAGEDPPAERRRRWGFGWDSGIAARYYVTPNWGLGLRVNPNVSDERGNDDGLWHYTQTGQPEEGSSEMETVRAETVSWGAGVMGFMEFDVAGSFRLGPYGNLTYGYYSRTRESSGTGEELRSGRTYDVVFRDRSTELTRSVTAQAGIRPVVLIGKRLRIETRIGAGATWSKHNDDWRSTNYRTDNGRIRTTEHTSRYDSEGWRIYTIGSDEILYTDVQVIFMF